MKLNKHTIYISLFAILYLIVAFSSFWHACAFFGLANNSWMSIILAFAFEVGQAAVLFSLLTSSKDRGRAMPWVLMSMFTLVQVIGNVYSSYKYIIINSVENLRYFKEPIFIWTDLPDAQANVIIVYLVGALLPIAALLLTSMITNYLNDIEEEKKIENKDEQQEEKSNNDNGQQSMETSGDSEGTKNKDTEDSKEENPLINQNSILQMENQGLEESNKKKDEQINELKNQLASRLDNLHGVEDEIEKLKKDLEIERSLHKDISEEFPKTVEEIAKKDEEIEKLKKELENLKQPKINQVPSFEESENKQKIKENIDLSQVEDLIKNGIMQDKLKESHFIN